MQPNDDFLMGELERQMENPFDFLGEYGRHMETVLNPSKAEDPLSKQLSMFEGICENQVIRPTVQQEEPAPLPLSGPIRGLRSPDPPIVDESTWRGIKEPQPPLFNKVRASRAGVRSSSDRSEGETYCWMDFQFVDKESCPACDQWDSLLELCGYEQNQDAREPEE